MKPILATHLHDRIELGGMQMHRELAVAPLLCRQLGGPEYVTLKEAMTAGDLVITEVSEGGSVPELRVMNSGARPVLLLDGEELAGAKQNRVVNTTVFVAAGATVALPVSCTERGRWQYQSRHFSDSGVTMSPSLRRYKNFSVFRSLQDASGFTSDQGGIWHRIDRLHAQHGTHSGTGAMKDAYEERRAEIRDYREAFPCREHQCGIAVMIRGRVAGIETVSRPDAYREIHEKLIDSYAMDIPLTRQSDAPAGEEIIRQLLERISASSEERYPSVGIGEDCRFQGSGLVGSALAVDGWLVHMAFFPVTEQEERGSIERMAPLSRRRSARFT